MSLSSSSSALQDAQTLLYQVRKQVIDGVGSNSTDEEKIDSMVLTVMQKLFASNLTSKELMILLTKLLFVRNVDDGNAGLDVNLSVEYEKIKAISARRVCGKVFKANDLAFSCVTCRADSTCVLCSDCFKDSDHEGHDYSFHRAGVGGCCDCGDLEAWNVNGMCSKHGNHGDDVDDNPQDKLPPQVAKQCHLVFDFVVKFLCDVVSEILQSYERVVPDYIFSEELQKEKWYVLLHNDDIHTFDEVKHALSVANSGKNLFKSADIKLMVNRTDKEGRSCVYVSDNANEKVRKKTFENAKFLAKTLEKHGLITSLSRSKQLEEEKKFIAVIQWFRSISKLHDGLTRLISIYLSKTCNQSGRIFGFKYMNYKCNIDNKNPKTAYPPLLELNAPELGLIFPDELAGPMIQYSPILDDIILYNPLFSKQLASHTQHLMIALFADMQFKFEYTRTFTRNYLSIAITYAAGLGLSDNTIFTEAVQIYTVPSVIRKLIELHDEQFFKDPTRIVDEDVSCAVLKSLYLFLLRASNNPDFSKLENSIVNLSNSLITKSRYSVLLNNTRYLLKLGCTPLVCGYNLGRDGSTIKHSYRLKLLLKCLSLVHNIDPQKRHQGSRHVMYESNTWLVAFNFSIVIATITRPSMSLLAYMIVKSATNDFHLFIKLSKLVIDECVSSINLCYQRDNSFKLGFSIIKGGPVSFHIPLHRFMFLFIRQISIYYSNEEFVIPDIFDSNNYNILRIIELPLRLSVMCSQIAIGKWKRNGQSMLHNLYYYKNHCYSHMYDIDINSLQIGAVLVSNEEFLETLVNAYGLKPWFFGMDRQLIKEQEYIIALAEEFLRMVIVLVTELPIKRQFGMALLRREIIHSLVTGPKPFSKIAERINLSKISMIYMSQKTSENLTFDEVFEGECAMLNESINTEMIEEILEVVSTKSIGMIDNSNHLHNESKVNAVVYSLKDDMWCEFDPYFWHLERTSQEKASEMRTEFYEKRYKDKTIATVAVPWVSRLPSNIVPCYQQCRTMLFSHLLIDTVIRCSFCDIVGTNKILAKNGVNRILIGADGELKGDQVIWDETIINGCRKGTSMKLFVSNLHVLTLIIHQLIGEIEINKLENIESTVSKLLAHESTSKTRSVPVSHKHVHTLSLYECIVALRDYSIAGFEKSSSNAMVDETEEDDSDINLNPEELYALNWIVQSFESIAGHSPLLTKVISFSKQQAVKLQRGVSSASTEKSSGLSRKDRAAEAQRLAMERIKAQQQSAFQSMLDDLSDSEEEDVDMDIENEERKVAADTVTDTGEETSSFEHSYCCSLCREKDASSNRPLAFIAFSQSSTWNQPLPSAALMTNTGNLPSDCFDSSITVPQLHNNEIKPAGWEPKRKPASSSSGTTNGGLGGLRENLIAQAVAAARATQQSNTSERLDWGHTEQANELDVDVEMDDVEAAAEEALLMAMNTAIDGVSVSTNDDSDLDLVYSDADDEAAEEMFQALDRAVNRSRELTGSNSLQVTVAPPDVLVYPGGTPHLFIQFCSHVLHTDCLEEYVKSLADKAQQERQYDGSNAVNIKMKEFLCPVCKAVSNTLVPFVPVVPSSMSTTVDSNAGLMKKSMDQEEDDTLKKSLDDSPDYKISKKMKLDDQKECANTLNNVNDWLCNQLAIDLTKPLIGDMNVSSPRAASSAVKTTSETEFTDEWVYSVNKEHSGKTFKSLLRVIVTPLDNRPMPFPSHTLKRPSMDTINKYAEDPSGKFSFFSVLRYIFDSVSYTLSSTERTMQNQPIEAVVSCMDRNWTQWRAYLTTCKQLCHLDRPENDIYTEEVRKPLCKLLVDGYNCVDGTSFGVADWLSEPVMLYSRTVQQSSKDANTKCVLRKDIKFHVFEETVDAKMRLSIARSPDNAAFISNKSDLYQTSLEVNDHILAVNGQSIDGMTINEISKLIMNSKTGDGDEWKAKLQVGRYAVKGALLDVNNCFSLLVTLVLSMSSGNFRSCLMSVQVVTTVQLVQSILSCLRFPSQVVDFTKQEIDDGMNVFDDAIEALGLNVLWDAVYKLFYKNCANSSENYESIICESKYIKYHMNKIIHNSMVPFLKSCAILLSIVCKEHHVNELDHFKDAKFSNDFFLYWNYLQLPSFQHIFTSSLYNTMDSWISAYCQCNNNAIPIAAPSISNSNQLVAVNPLLSVNFNIYSKLIPLPKKFDELYSYVLNGVKCATNNSLIKEPAICLRCGCVLCAGANCCKRRRIGAVCRHIEACCGGSGALLFVQRSEVLLVRNGYSAFVSSPYLDAHGEADVRLRRGKPLQLDDKQYQQLENMCISHQVAHEVVQNRNNTYRVIVRHFF